MSKFVSITFYEDALSTRAAELLNRARLQNDHLAMITKPDDQGQITLDVIDYDSLGSDDTFSVRVKSKLTYKERCLKYGVLGIEGRSVQRDEKGIPMRNAKSGAYIPTQEYIDNVIAAYGDPDKDESARHRNLHTWSLRDASEKAFGLIRGGKVTGNEAFELLAQECQDWCENGEWYVILPRGKDGGRPPIGQEAMKRRNVMLSQEDYDYLVSIGNNASAGIRQAIAAHKGGQQFFVKYCTDQWLEQMAAPERWDTFDGRMAALQSFPVGIDATDPRVIAFGQQMADHWKHRLDQKAI